MLAVLALLGVCAGKSVVQPLQDWLQCEECKTLSSTELYRYVPPPLNPETVDAYDRFSIFGAVHRLLVGPGEVEHERKQMLSESDLEAVSSAYKLGLVYFWSLGGVKRDFGLALKYFEQGAREGDADAMFMLGVAYSTGFLGDEGPTPDPARATLYYTLGASQGSLLAQVAMGHRMFLGINTAVDTESAMLYYSLAGDTLLDEALQSHEGDRFYSERMNRRTYAFGAEMNTGLYGKHAYKKYLPPDMQTMLPLGDQSSAWNFVSTGFMDEFDNLDDALDTFVYRAQEESDIAAVYALARIFSVGTSTLPPRWNTAVYYAEVCDAMDRMSIKSTLQLGQHLAIRSLCQEFLADRYLHGNEGVEQNIGTARSYYKKAELTAQYAAKRLHQQDMPGIHVASCRGCAMGLALCDWREGVVNNTNLVSVFKEALQKSHVSSDYTLPMILAEAQVYLEDDAYGAMETLRKTITDTMGFAPEASLRLGQLEQSTHSKLKRYLQGVYGMEEAFSPLLFAQTSYDSGDLDSTVLAYMVCSELGIRSAALNLADLLDVQHSYLGAILSRYWSRLRAVSEWRLPKFVNARIVHAVHYFAIAAAHESVDGLTKLVEYSFNYDILPAELRNKYLNMLTMHDFGFAHWMVGNIFYARGLYAKAMQWFSRAMISPEAWVPVKFSQFLTVLHLLNGDGEDNSMQSTSFWGWLSNAYHTIIALDGGSSAKRRSTTKQNYILGDLGSRLVGTLRNIEGRWWPVLLCIPAYLLYRWIVHLRGRRLREQHQQ